MQRLKGVVVPVGVAVVIILVVITVGGAVWNAQQETAESALPALATAPQAVVSTPPAKPSTSSSPTAKPTVATASASASMPPPPAPPAIQPVAPSAPTFVTVSAPGFTVNAEVDGVDYNDELAAPSCSESPDPECPQKAYWIQNQLGVAPGSEPSPDPLANDSTYFVGHSWTQDPRVFDRLSDYAMTHYDPTVVPMTSTDQGGNPLPDVETRVVPSLVGSVITVKTGTGTLTYVVSKVYIAPKTDVGRTDEYRRGRDHQAKFNTCGIDLLHQVDTDYAVIINADLTAAVPL